MYAALGLSALIFVVHGILLNGWKVQNWRMSIDWMALMALFNLLGATCYAARVCLASLSSPFLLNSYCKTIYLYVTLPDLLFKPNKGARAIQTTEI